MINLVAHKWSLGSLYRLFIPEFIKTSKVIYLDCDILVNMDIIELWSVDTEGFILAGVPGYLHGFPDVVRKKLNEIDYRIYVNSGVLIMNLQQIRQKGNLFELSMKWFSRHSHIATLPDQDALNSIFRGNIKIIDSKYNNSHLDENLSDAIVHTWPHKSWLGLAGFRSDALYWKMYLRSAWGENISADELIDILNNASLKNRPKKKSLIIRSFASAKKKILWWQPIRLMNFLCKEAMYRIICLFKRS